MDSFFVKFILIMIFAGCSKIKNPPIIGVNAGAKTSESDATRQDEIDQLIEDANSSNFDDDDDEILDELDELNDLNDLNDDTGIRKSTGEVFADLETTDPDIGFIEFITPTEAMISDVKSVEYYWEAVDTNISFENILFESILCSEADCQSPTCGDEMTSQDDFRLIELTESVPAYLCVRSISSDLELVSDWSISNSMTFIGGDLDILMENQINTVLAVNNEAVVLGNLRPSREIPSPTFAIVPADNGDHEYFNLDGDSNSIVTLNLDKMIPADVTSITLTVKISNYEEIQEKSFTFLVEHPSSDVNLVTNGNFGDNVEGWRLTNKNSYVVLEDNGDSYLQVTVQSEADLTNITQTISLEANSSYTLSVRIGGDFDETVPPGPIVVDTKGQFDDVAQFSLRQDADWNDFSGTFTTGAEPTELIIRLFQERQFRGVAKYDKIKLFKN